MYNLRKHRKCVFRKAVTPCFVPVSHVEHGTDYAPNTTLFVVLRHEITILIIFKITKTLDGNF